MGKKKKERSKPELCLSERYVQYCDAYQNAPNNPNYKDFIRKFFGLDNSHSLITRNEDVEVIAFCKNENVQKVLLELGDKGADVVAIYNCIKSPELLHYEIGRPPQKLAFIPGAELHPQFNEMVAYAAKIQKEFKRREKALRRGMKIICSPDPRTMIAVDELRKYHPYFDERPEASQKELEAFVTDFHERLEAWQKELQTVITHYIENAPYQSLGKKAGKESDYVASNWERPITKNGIPKKITSKSPCWIARIITIFNELKKIGFSDNKAYKKIMDLFALAFPEIWGKKDPDLIRQRIYYHTKTKK
jgi:uncharacterized protein (UPF0335 family)